MPIDDTTLHVRGVAIVGGGPAGLMAADVLSAAGVSVELFDAMPTVGRKFLLAGKGGLNLTHGEPADDFLQRYGARRAELAPSLSAFGPDTLRAWAAGLGVETFVGSSGRVFPVGMQAAPLLRAWLVRLRAAGVRFHMRHRWLGQAPQDGARHVLRFAAPRGEVRASAEEVVLALGGGSWAALGSDGAWVPLLQRCGVDVAPLRPSNCGFDVARTTANAPAPALGWTEHFRTRFAGHALKNVALSIGGDDVSAGTGIRAGADRGATGAHFTQLGELVITDTGVEGSLVYAASALLRDGIEAAGRAVAHLDLLPGRSAADVEAELRRPRGSRSLATHLKGRLGLHGVKAALLHELLPRELLADAGRLAAAIKSLPLELVATRPLDEAISTAGGVRFSALDHSLMLRERPGVFCAGEMLDWEAPTGGYLLTACFATGAAAARGVIAHRHARGPEASRP